MTDLKRPAMYQVEFSHDQGHHSHGPLPSFCAEVENFWQDVGGAHGADVRGRLDHAFRGMRDDIDRSWAIIVFDREYRIGGHLAQLRRRKRHLHLQCYKDESWEAIRTRGDVSVSIMLVRRKRILAELSAQSPFLGAAWDMLRHQSEGRHWIVILPPFLPTLETEFSANNVESYRAAQEADLIKESEDALACSARWGLWRNAIAQALAGGDLEAAEAMLERVVGPPGHLVCPAFLLGRIKRRLGKYEEALPHLEHALRKAPRHVDTHIEWARLLAAQGNTTGSLAGFERALALDPFDEETWAEMGILRGKTGELGGAVAAISRAVEINSTSAPAWDGLGRALYAVDRFKESALAFEAAALRDPKSAVYWNNAAFLCALAGEPGKALPLCRQALALDPGLCDAWDSLGVISQRLGRLQDALKAFEQGLRLIPEHEPCLNHLAELQREMAAQGDSCSGSGGTPS